MIEGLWIIGMDHWYGVTPGPQGKVFKERVAYSRTVAEGCQRALDLVAVLESSDRGVASHHKMGSDAVEG